jgi:hypothetical protein
MARGALLAVLFVNSFLAVAGVAAAAPAHVAAGERGPAFTVHVDDDQWD